MNQDRMQAGEFLPGLPSVKGVDGGGGPKGTVGFPLAAIARTTGFMRGRQFGFTSRRTKVLPAPVGSV